VAAIGDADDDTGMLELADASYAPRNCAPAVRRLARRGACRVLRRPFQQGLLAAVRAELRRQSPRSPRDTGAMRPRVAGADSLLVTLLQAAEHGTCRHWLDALLWWML